MSLVLCDIWIIYIYVNCDLWTMDIFLCDVWIIYICVNYDLWTMYMWYCINVVTGQCIFDIWYCILVSIFTLSYAAYMFRFKFSLTARFRLFFDRIYPFLYYRLSRYRFRFRL